MRAKPFSYLLIPAALMVLCACGEKEPKGFTRIEGLPSEPAAPPPPAGAPMSGHGTGEIVAGALRPGVADAATTDPDIRAPETKVIAGGNKLQVASIAFTLPDDWKKVEVASRVRQAQYEIPGAAGPAELAVFYFGPGQGGGIEDNVRRWAGQFTPEGETTGAETLQVARVERDDLRLALVKTHGTYDPGSMGPTGPAPSGPRPNHALFGLVVEGGPEGSVFVKVTGPRATMQEWNEKLEAFAQSAKVSAYK